MTDTFIFSSDMAPTAPVVPNPAGGLPSFTGMPLVRRDILAFEKILRDDLAAILPFEAHALYFPMEDEIGQPVWIPEEAKLLLPLRRGDALLGVLLLRNPEPEAAKSLLDYLPAIVSLCLDKLSLYKWGRSDGLTGLATKEVLLDRLSREMGQLRRDFVSGPDMEDLNTGEEQAFPADGSPKAGASYQGTMGIVVVRLRQMRRIARSHGHGMAEKLMRALGASLRDILPEQALAARTADEEFAILVPGAIRQSMDDLARSCVFTLENVRLPGRLTGLQVKIEAHAGYALFPQDWEARHEGREGDDIRSEAESLFDKARLASFRAGESGKVGDHVLGYGSILPQGGMVDKILPLSRVQTTLGRDVGAREGQIFTVWSMDYPVQSRTGGDDPLEPIYKGEIVLADVREDSSQADILLLGDPAWELEPGDQLRLVADDRGVGLAEPDRPGRQDSLTGLYRHGDFLARLAVAREKCASFGLVLLRCQLPFPESDKAGGAQRDTEHGMGEAMAMLRRLLDGRADYAEPAEAPAAGKDEDGKPALLAGRYSLNSILVFHPYLDAERAREIYEPIAREMTDLLGTEVAMGIACLPWLSYRPADAVECCRKALEYALLLPEPHVGVFDSLAINISADKCYSQGDVFGAIEEYRMALLADENNTLAWNSLGVCLSGVGRHTEARRSFEQAARRDLRDAAVHYNLGTACIHTGDLLEAARQFRACLDLEPEYTIADIKLGELAERDQDYVEARKHFERALKSDPMSPVPYRCLARIDLAAGNPDKARERLHQALLRNPQDAFSLHLMARLYLDGGEDPELAETLARQSVTLRPDRKAAWLELARALEAQGRHRDARESRMRAGEL